MVRCAVMRRQSVETEKVGQVLGSLRWRLLVVDENLEDLLYYSAVLRDQGYEVRSVSSFRDGAAMLERENFDLILVSQGSANFEGRSVLARALERDRHNPVLVLTRSFDMPCSIEAMQLGALDYMENPMTPGEISLLVGKCLHSRSGSP